MPEKSMGSALPAGLSASPVIASTAVSFSEVRPSAFRI